MAEKSKYRATPIKFDDASLTFPGPDLWATSLAEAISQAREWGKKECAERGVEKAWLLLHSYDDPNKPVHKELIEAPISYWPPLSMGATWCVSNGSFRSVRL